MVYVQIWTRQSNGYLSEAVVARLVNDRRHRREAARQAVLRGLPVEVLSLDSVVHFFKTHGITVTNSTVASGGLEGERVRARQAVGAEMSLMRHGELLDADGQIFLQITY